MEKESNIGMMAQFMKVFGKIIQQMGMGD